MNDDEYETEMILGLADGLLDAYKRSPKEFATEIFALATSSRRALLEKAIGILPDGEAWLERLGSR